MEFHIEPETFLSGRRKRLFSFFALLLLVFITYSNTFDVPWHFDDTSNILQNKPLHLKEFSFEDLKKTFFADYKNTGKLYRPAACFSLALNYYLHGENVYGYHVVNLAIHFLSACFLFLFVYRTLNLPILKAKYQSQVYFIALLSAVFWAVNPVQTQAVTYVVQRMTSMAGLFSIMAMYFYLRARTSTQRTKKALHFSGCCLFGVLAIGSKENAVMLPVNLLIYDLILVEGISKHFLKKYALYGFLVLVLCIIISLLVAGPSMLSIEHLVSGYHNRGFTLTERLLTEPRVILFYISLLLYPMPDRLCLEHDINLSTGLLTPISTFFSISAIILVLAFAVSYAKRAPLISFCTIFFFLNHLVESSVFPLEVIFEHRNYFPSMLFFVPFAWLISIGFSYFSKRPFFKCILAAFVVLTLIGWGHATYARNTVWRTNESLLLDCVIKCPELGRPHHNLGAYYGKNNMLNEAVSEYLTALSKENRNNLAARNWTYYNLGAIYQKLNQDEKALYYYNQAQKYHPSFPPTFIGKGLLFMKKGEYAEATLLFQKAIKADPKSTSAYGNLGFLYLLTGNMKGAIENLRIATEKSSENAKVLRHLGVAYKLSGNSKQAYLCFKQSLSIDPSDPFTLLNLAFIYDKNGMVAQKDEMMDQFFQALEKSQVTIAKFRKGLTSRPGADNFLSAHQKSLLKTLDDVMTQQRFRRKNNTTVVAE